jgi:hypothetical protein
MPSLRNIAAFTAMLVFTLTACREDKPTASSSRLPQKSALTERSEDLRTLIHKELTAGKKRIVIPSGRYRVQAEHGNHLVFSNLTNVEILAENVELVCTSTVRALMFENCANVTIRGLTVDYDPLPFTQGKITAMSPDKSWLELEIIQGYPDDKLKGPFQIYDSATKSLRRGDARWSDDIKSLGNRRYRVSKAQRYRFDPAEDTEQTGDILVAKNAFGKAGSPHAIELQGCKGMRFEDITVFASPSFGFLERHCDGSTYLRCIVDRRNSEDDPVKRAVPRMRALNADAFHSKDASKGPSIIACTARFMGDDAVNINGRYHYVRGTSGRQARIAIIDPTATIHQGDPVQFLPYSGPRPSDAKVVRRQPDSQPFTEEEKEFIRQLRMDERMRADLLEGQVTFFTLTLDREISLPPGSAVCCPLRLGNGFAVKDCDFGDNRSRGILIKASNGEVSGNRITNSRMAAVLVSPEFWWMEAGMSSDVVIKGNIIGGCLQTPIQVHARGGNRAFLPAGALRNISILNNRIEDSAWPVIHVTSASGLIIKDNILPTSPSGEAGGKHNKSTDPVLLENCDTTP